MTATDGADAASKARARIRGMGVALATSMIRVAGYWRRTASLTGAPSLLTRRTSSET